jgi:acetyl esterase/lipase
MHDDDSVLTRAAPAADTIVAYGEHAEQVADIRYGGDVAETRPLVVIVHGGFWRPQYGREQAGSMAAALAAAGWTVVVLNYRRIPGAPDASIEDVRLATHALPARVSGHDGRVLLVGHSAGGHLALLAGLAPAPESLCGILALAPAADLQRAYALALGGGAVADYLGGSPDARPDLDPRLCNAPVVPTRLLHGDQDAVVPLEVSASYVAAHPQVALDCLSDCGHFALIDPLSREWPTVVAALTRLGC